MSLHYTNLRQNMRCFISKCLIACFGFLLLTAGNPVLAQATLSTDKPDYPPGSTVILTGSGFQSGEPVTLQVLHDGEGDNDESEHQPWTVTADESGNFVTTWHIPVDGDELNAVLVATADGQLSGLHAATTFTDANWTIGPSYNDLCGGVETELTFTITQTVTSTASPFPNGRFRIVFPAAGMVSSALIVSVSNSKNWIISLLAGNDVCLRAATSADALADLETIVFKLVVIPPNSIGQAQINGVSMAFGANCPTSGTAPTLPLNIIRVNRLSPVFTQCPSPDITVNTDAGLCSGVVNYTAQAAGSSPVVSYEFSGATTGSGSGTGSGSAFNKGTTHVKLTATNSCASAYCEFNVTVNDNEAPSITCPQNIVLSACEGTAMWDIPGVTDNCPGATIQQTEGPAPGSTIDNGTSTTVTYVATDASNNQTTCSFTISRAEELTATCTNTNAQLYFGYAGDQSSTVKVVPSGGAGPYKISISMNRALKCNVITSTGDELWIGGTGTTSSSNTTCPAAGDGDVPVSEAEDVTSYSVKVTLMADADITATITDADGCITTCTTHISAEDVRCFAGNSEISKVTICHQTGSTKNPCVTICVDESAVEEHLAHGDFYGNCGTGCSATSSLVNSSSILQKESLTVAEKLKVKVFPNPATTEFKLRLESNSSEEVRIIVTDIYGHQVYQAKGTIDQLYIFGQNFKSGMYIIKAVQGKQIQTLKVTKGKG